MLSLDPTDLRFIDEHCVRVHGSAEAVWTALAKVLGREMKYSTRFAQLLGCEPAHGTAGFGARPGETVPGFRVAEAQPGRCLELRGRHRFAQYALTFELRGDRLCAQTHAAFPGLLGRLYRALVIGSGGHRLITRWMLRRIAHAA